MVCNIRLLQSVLLLTQLSCCPYLLLLWEWSRSHRWLHRICFSLRLDMLWLLLHGMAGSRSWVQRKCGMLVVGWGETNFSGCRCGMRNGVGFCVRWCPSMVWWLTEVWLYHKIMWRLKQVWTVVFCSLIFWGWVLWSKLLLILCLYLRSRHLNRILIAGLRSLFLLVFSSCR